MRILRAIGTAISKFIAFLFTIVFIAVTVAILFAFNFERQALSAESWKQALQTENVYQRFPALVAEQIVRLGNYDPCRDNPSAVENPEECQGGQSVQTEEGGPPPFLNNLTQAQWEQILAELLPPDLLQRLADSVIDQVFAFADAPEGQLRITISLVELKERLAGEAGVNAVLTLLRSQPPCTPEELATLSLDMESGFPACSPPEEQIAQLKPMLQEQLPAFVNDLPDTASPDLGQPGAGANPAGGPSPREVFVAVRQGVSFSPLISVALLAPISLFGVRSFKGWLRWWGIPLVFIALLAWSAAVMAIPALNTIFVQTILPNLPPYQSVELIRTGLNILAAVLRTVLQPVRTQALLLGGAGLAAYVVSLFVRPEPSAD